MIGAGSQDKACGEIIVSAFQEISKGQGHLDAAVQVDGQIVQKHSRNVLGVIAARGQESDSQQQRLHESLCRSSTCLGTRGAGARDPTAFMC